MAIFSKAKQSIGGFLNPTEIQGESFSGVNEGRGNFNAFGRTSFALNNLFIFDDTIQGAKKDGQAPLFSLRGNFPYSEVETFNYHNGNSQEYFPGLNDVNQIEIDLYEADDSRVYRYFEEWHSLIYHKNGTYNIPTVFKKDLWVKRVSPYGIPEGDSSKSNRARKQVFGLMYRGVFPIKISDYSPDSSDSSITTFTITFSCDGVVILKPSGESTILSEISGVVEPTVTSDGEALDIWKKVTVDAEAKTAETQKEINSRRPLREQVADALNVKKKLVSAIPGTPETQRKVAKVGTKSATVAHNLVFTKGRDFTNLGF